MNLQMMLKEKGYAMVILLLFQEVIWVGIDGTNDLVITVNTVYVPVTSKKYSFTNFTDDAHTNNGTFNIHIERDNTALDYNIIGLQTLQRPKITT